jgi:integrase/recombinase XerD
MLGNSTALVEVASGSLAEVSDKEVAGRVLVAYLASLGTESSRVSTRSAIKTLCKVLPGAPEPGEVAWHRLGREGLMAMVAGLRERKIAPATALRCESALVGLLREAVRGGWLSHETFARWTDFARTKVSRPEGHQAAGRRLSPQELAAIFEASGIVGNSPAAKIRNKTMVAILIGCGLRREEVGKLEYPTSGILSEPLPLTGKGQKVRFVALPDWAVPVVQTWVALRGRAPGPLLYQVNRHGQIQVGKGIGATSIALCWNEIAGVAEVEATLHDLRRTWISDQLARGTDITLVARMVGHSNPKTTASYDRRGLAALSTAANAVPAPFPTGN